jgi:hypothetical protein
MQAQMVIEITEKVEYKNHVPGFILSEGNLKHRVNHFT